jgi:hypothetical protein
VRYLIQIRMTFAVMKAGRCSSPNAYRLDQLASTLTENPCAQYLRRDLIDDQIAVAPAELETTGAPPVNARE